MTDINPQQAYDQIEELKEQRDRWYLIAGNRGIETSSLTKILTAQKNGNKDKSKRITELKAKLDEIKAEIVGWYKYDFENPDATEFMDSGQCADRIKAILERKL